MLGIVGVCENDEEFGCGDGEVEEVEGRRSC